MERNDNEAYCIINSKEKKYCIYSQSLGKVSLQILKPDEEVKVKWLNIIENNWLETKTSKLN